MAKKSEILDAAPLVEVAPPCDHVRSTEMKQDDTTRVFLVRDFCPLCGWSAEWKPQSEAILKPIEFPLVQVF